MVGMPLASIGSGVECSEQIKEFTEHHPIDCCLLATSNINIPWDHQGECCDDTRRCSQQAVFMECSLCAKIL
jgi:hypothetical protein